jgi:hypothetical protein
MTDRSNDAPGDEAAAEEAPDLSDAQLVAATDAAEAEVEEDEAGGETIAESEIVDEQLDGGDVEDEAGDVGDFEAAGVVPATPVRVGARQRAAEAAAARAAAAGRGPKVRAATRVAFPIDPAMRIKDPASAIFVVASVIVFVLIFLNAMAFGHGGAFNPVPTPTPFVSAAPTASPAASPGASGSAAPSTAPTAAPSGTAPATTTAPTPS